MLKKQIKQFMATEAMKISRNFNQSFVAPTQIYTEPQKPLFKKEWGRFS